MALKETSNNNNFVKDMLMGGTSGVIAKTVIAPLERVKILLQTNSVPINGVPYKGIMDCYIRVYKEQGMAAFWRGNLANCLRYFPTQAMNFACKEKYQELFVRPKEQVGFPIFFAGYLLAGGLAGATSLTVSYPLEYAFTRLAADNAQNSSSKQFNGIFDCIKKTYKSDGFKGVYRGYIPSCIGIIIYRAGYFGIYDTSLTFLPLLGISSEQQHSFSGIMSKMVLALFVDIFASLTAYPLDTVRRRLMMQSGSEKKMYNNMSQTFSYIHQNYGWKGFYKGALQNSIRSIGSALVLVLYGEFKHFI